MLHRTKTTNASAAHSWPLLSHLHLQHTQTQPQWLIVLKRFLGRFLVCLAANCPQSDSESVRKINKDQNLPPQRHSSDQIREGGFIVVKICRGDTIGQRPCWTGPRALDKHEIRFPVQRSMVSIKRNSIPPPVFVEPSSWPISKFLHKIHTHNKNSVQGWWLSGKET